MHGTAQNLEEIAGFLAAYGLHTGDQFAAIGPDGHIQLDICAVAYFIAEHASVPNVFFTDEGAARNLIEGSEPTMACIRAISAAIHNYEIPDSDGRPDLIEHVSQWTFTPPIGEQQPPTLNEVIGCIERASRHAATQTPAA